MHCQDNHDDDMGTQKPPALSPRAREIKRQIENGTYQVDIPSLAERLLEKEDGPVTNLPTPKNDEKPRDT